MFRDQCHLGSRARGGGVEAAEGVTLSRADNVVPKAHYVLFSRGRLVWVMGSQFPIAESAISDLYLKRRNVRSADNCLKPTKRRADLSASNTLPRPSPSSRSIAAPAQVLGPVIAVG